MSGGLLNRRPLLARVESPPTTNEAGWRAETRKAFISARASAISCGEERWASRLRVTSSSSTPDGSISKLRPALAISWRREGLVEARMSGEMETGAMDETGYA